MTIELLTDPEGDMYPPEPFDPFLLVLFGLGFAADVTQSVADVTRNMLECAARHANHRIGQQNFATQTARAIETITADTKTLGH